LISSSICWTYQSCFCSAYPIVCTFRSGHFSCAWSVACTIPSVENGVVNMMGNLMNWIVAGNMVAAVMIMAVCSARLIAWRLILSLGCQLQREHQTMAGGVARASCGPIGDCRGWGVGVGSSSDKEPSSGASTSLCCCRCISVWCSPVSIWCSRWHVGSPLVVMVWQGCYHVAAHIKVVSLTWALSSCIY